MSLLLRRGVLSSGLSGGGIQAANFATFNGTTSLLSTPDNAAFTCTTMSMSCVFKTADSNVRQSLIRNRPLGAFGTVSGITAEIVSGFFSTNCAVEGTGGGYTHLDPIQIAVVNDTWYHFVMTFDGTDLAIYIDSVKKVITQTKSGTVGTIDSTTLMEIGAISSGRTIDGSLAIVRFWKDRVLNQTEVTTLYNSGDSKCFADLGSLQTSITYAPEFANWDGPSTGDELTDQSSSGLTTTNSNVVFTTTGQNVDCS